MKTKFSFLLLFILSACSIYAQKNVAVYISSDIAGNYKSLAESNIMEAITRDPDLYVIERNNQFLSVIQKEIDYQLSGNVNPNQISAIGEQFGAQYIVVVHVGAGIISGKIINVESALVVSAQNLDYLGDGLHRGFNTRIKVFPELLLGSFKYPQLVNAVEMRTLYSGTDIKKGRIIHGDSQMQMIKNRDVLRYLMFVNASRDKHLFHVIYDYYVEEEKIPISRRKNKTRVTYYVNYLDWHTSVYPEMETATYTDEYVDDVIVNPKSSRFYYGMQVFYCPTHLMTW